MSTLKEVAKEAGVSTITVSRVINTPDLVKADTKHIVHAAMKKLKYLPNQAAKALVTNKVGVVKVLIPQTIELNHPFSMNFIAGISESLSRQLYSFSLIRSPEITQKCDGIIVMGLNREDEMDMIRELNIPIVLFGRCDEPDMDWVDVDNKHGAYLMTEHLISLGHTNIGMIMIDDKKNFCYDRLEGYTQALKDHGIPLSHNLIKYARNLESDGFRTATELMLARSVSAIFCSSDILALGAIRAAKLLNKNVPQDISIAGFDGLGINLLTEPKITTVRQPVYALGMRMAEVLLKKINNPSQAEVREFLKTDLLIEHSVVQNHSV